MPAYAVGIIKETRFSDDVRKYLQRIDSTLRVYSGRFIADKA
jgi:hypothetical protein